MCLPFVCLGLLAPELRSRCDYSDRSPTVKEKGALAAKPSDKPIPERATTQRRDRKRKSPHDAPDALRCTSRSIGAWVSLVGLGGNRCPGSLAKGEPMSTGRAPEAAPRVGRSGAPDVGPHVVQFYERDAFLVLETARFIGAGLGAGEAAVLIATRPHLDRLEVTLAARGVRLDLVRAQGRYVELDAAETLAQILIDGAPDPVRFADVVGETIERAAERHARVRAFGEMVALLWAEGRQDAALALEQLWNDLVARLPLSLLCAYPLTTPT